MTRLAIQGVGAVGGFGCGVEALRRALVGELPLPQPAPAGEGRSIPALLADDGALEEFIPRRSLRRIDHFSRLALLGACLALQDAGRQDADRSRLGVVIATGWGAVATTFSFLHSFLEGGDVCSSPTHFSNSVHNAAAANVSIQLGVTGPSLTVSQFELSLPSALLTARRWLAEERVEAVLVGGVDEYCPELGYCWRRFFGDPDGDLRPFEFDRQSAFPGEGAAFLLLERGDRESRYGYLTDVQQGNLAGGLPPLPSRLLLGADGHRACGAFYQRHLPVSTPLAAGASVQMGAGAPVWGSLPVGPAFDLAAAALAARDNRLFAPAAGGGSTLLAGEPFGEEPLGCLKFGRGGDFGLLTVQR